MKRNILILMVLSLMFSFLFAEVNYVPKLIVLEQFVSSVDDNTFESYKGLQALQKQYHSGEVITVRYFTDRDGGDYSSASVKDMFEAYNVENLPTTIVNGKHKILDTKSEVKWGEAYASMVNREYYKPSPVKLHTLNFNRGTGEIEVSLDLLTTEAIQEGTIRFILMENEVTDSITNVARLVISEPLSITQQNETIQVTKQFSIDSNWNVDNLDAIVYIADSDDYIVQAISTFEVPQKGNLRAVIPNQRIDIGGSNGQTEQPFFSLFNLGADGEFGISIVNTYGKDGWFLTYCDEHSCFFGPSTFTLNEGEYKEFHANIMPTEPGVLEYHFLVTISDDTKYSIPLMFITNDVEYLVIDGDGGNVVNWDTTDILDQDGVSYGVWDTDFAEASSIIAEHWNKLIWVTGNRQPALSGSDIDFLKLYLSKENALYITGNSIGSDLVLSDYNQDLSFYEEYLAATLVSDRTEEETIIGVPQDPITDGLSFNIYAGFANQPGPEVIEPNHENSEVIFKYADETTAGVRTILDSGARVVYTSFGFEFIESVETSAELLYNVLNWFEVTSVEEGLINVPSLTKTELYPSYPNPFSLSKAADSVSSRSVTNGITISYNIDRKEIASHSLSIYNIRGQKVKEFPVLNAQENGAGQVVWDVKDDSGRMVVSGVYFSVLKGKSGSKAQKLLIIK
ncbi:MAG: T9SS type A sorting domain-containing protein [Candidatus Cloacimonas sp.]|nr:T9SS type A sorting domain-containing protein [Candidatus Cloacimonadota bacterium]